MMISIAFGSYNAVRSNSEWLFSISAAISVHISIRSYFRSFGPSGLDCTLLVPANRFWDPVLSVQTFYDLSSPIPCCILHCKIHMAKSVLLMSLFFWNLLTFIKCIKLNFRMCGPHSVASVDP